jgi:hypothetical protein
MVYMDTALYQNTCLKIWWSRAKEADKGFTAAVKFDLDPQ